MELLDQIKQWNLNTQMKNSNEEISMLKSKNLQSEYNNEDSNDLRIKKLLNVDHRSKYIISSNNGNKKGLSS